MKINESGNAEAAAEGNEEKLYFACMKRKQPMPE